jgi:hypothetical protein
MNEFDELLASETKSTKQEKNVEKKKQQKKKQQQKKYQPAKRIPWAAIILGILCVVFIGTTVLFAANYADALDRVEKVKKEVQYQEVQKDTDPNKKVSEVYRRVSSTADSKEIKDSQLDYTRNQLKSALSAAAAAKNDPSLPVPPTLKELGAIDAINEFFRQYFVLDDKDANKVTAFKLLLERESTYEKIMKENSPMKEFNTLGGLTNSTTAFYMGEVDKRTDFMVIAPYNVSGKIIPQFYKLQLNNEYKVISMKYLGMADLNYQDVFRAIEGAKKIEVPKQADDKSTKKKSDKDKDSVDKESSDKEASDKDNKDKEDSDKESSGEVAKQNDNKEKEKEKTSSRSSDSSASSSSGS